MVEPIRGEGREVDEEAWKRKMKRWEDWVKGHEKIFGESQWEWWREVWGFLAFPYHGSEGVAMVGTGSTVSPPVGNGVEGIRVRGIQ